MSKPARNSLQEYYQKRHLPLPVYNVDSCSVHTSGTQKNLYVAEVTLCCGRTYKSDPYPNKKASISAAAEKALSALHSEKETKLQDSYTDRKFQTDTSLLIDVENNPGQAMDLLTKWKFPYYVIPVVGRSSPLVDKLSGLQIANSTRKDAADIEIILLATRLMENGMIKRVIVFSRDALFGTFKECAEQHYPDVEIIHETSFKSLIREAEALSQSHQTERQCPRDDQ